MSAYQMKTNLFLKKDRPINHLLNGSSKIFNRQKRKLSTGKNVLNGWSYAELLPKSGGAYEDSGAFHQYEHQVDASIAERLSKFTNQHDVTLASVMYTLWEFCYLSTPTKMILSLEQQYQEEMRMFLKLKR